MHPILAMCIGTADAAVILGWSELAVLDAIDAGGLPAVSLPDGTLIVPEAAVLDLAFGYPPPS